MQKSLEKQVSLMERMPASDGPHALHFQRGQRAEGRASMRDVTRVVRRFDNEGHVANEGMEVHIGGSADSR